MNEVSHQSLQQSLLDLDTAFKQFYKKLSKYPKRKKKHQSKQSFRVAKDIKLKYSVTSAKYGYLSITKFRDDPIKVRIHRILPPEYKIRNATISKTKSGKYYVSLLIEYQPQGGINLVNVKNDGIGIDMGIKDTIILSTGQKYSFPINADKYDKKIRRLQKSKDRKYQKGKRADEQSKNYEKQRIKLAKAYEKITNIKEDWIHKITKKLVTESQGSYIFLEDLSIKGMLKNHKLAKSVSFQSWYKFKTILSYKAEWNGKKVVSIGRFEPSTKTCSKCGYVNNELTLKDREWICPECGTNHDRDVNAAINIKNFGIKQLVTA